MARIRTIKPTHWNDKELSKIPLQAHLLWIATWNFSDDDGVFEADPLLLKSQIFPRRTDVRVEQIAQWLDQLVKARFLIPFEYKNEGYYVSRTFKIHQRIDKPQPGLVPFEELKRVFQEYSKNVPGTLLPVEYSIVEDSKVLGAYALVVPENAPAVPEPAIETNPKTDYQKIVDQLSGKEKTEVWLTIKNFITERKPGFIEPYVDIWNVFASSLNLPQVQQVSDSRKKKFNTRIREPAFDLLKVMESVKKSGHLRGDNSRGWKVTFDWILENDQNYLKIIEGQYE